ncbi:helix-turn-helix transcriptional regulator [Novispirillum itersonii]|uniref:AraC-like DNA-binding protein n=1 Tax=Novispirillum itersonii TaxID=189 RepID=A0A7W9ZJ53_NOVIT|nr:AraC family transcriptional regulator [Novispirillum itersonii]MBB6211214.1 AraC-like DNA-binding protein [Novispirillum itersonii]
MEQPDDTDGWSLPLDGPLHLRAITLPPHSSINLPDGRRLCLQAVSGHGQILHRQQSAGPVTPESLLVLEGGPGWTLSTSGADPLQMVVLTTARTHPGTGDSPASLRRFSPGFRTLAAQILVCPLQGRARDLFRRGKGLELAAMTLHRCGSSRPDPATDHPEAARLVCAVLNSLDGSFTPAPDPEDLARRLGVTAPHLSAAFKAVKGVSLHRFLQERRLAEAFRLLAQDGLNASVAAYRVGYTPAHFSTVFRQRFGLSPRDVTPRRAAGA